MNYDAPFSRGPPKRLGDTGPGTGGFRSSIKNSSS